MPGPTPPTRLWYDKNPIAKTDQIAGCFTSHSYTTRLLYTVPARRKAIVEMIYASVIRSVAASTPHEPKFFVSFWISGDLYDFVLVWLNSSQNAVKDKDSFAAGGNVLLNAGDKIEFYTSDDSTGGECCYNAGYKLTEFDA